MNLPQNPAENRATETALFDSLRWANSTKRPWIVLDWAARLHWAQGEVFWEVVNEEWSSFDLIPHKQFEKAFRFFKLFAPREGIPPHVTIYRGQSKSAPLGLSWTTSRAVAESFAHGHRGIRHPDPVIYSLVVKRKQIAFLCDERQESEIVLFSIPRSKSKLLTVEAIA